MKRVRPIWVIAAALVAGAAVLRWTRPPRAVSVPAGPDDGSRLVVTVHREPGDTITEGIPGPGRT